MRLVRLYLPFSFSKVFLNLSTNTIFDVLVWGCISRYPKQKKIHSCYFLIKLQINYKMQILHWQGLLTTHDWWLPVLSVFGPDPPPLNMQQGFLLKRICWIVEFVFWSESHRSISHLLYSDLCTVPESEMSSQ